MGAVSESVVEYLRPGRRVLFLDTETTGFSEQDHRVVEIALVEMVAGKVTGHTWHRHLNPEQAMPREAWQVHGLDDAFLADKPAFRDVATDLLAFLAGGTLVAYVAKFDMKFLNAELARAGRHERLTAIDGHSIAINRVTEDKVSLDALQEHYGIELRLEHRGAMQDAFLLADIWAALIADKPLQPSERTMTAGR